MAHTMMAHLLIGTKVPVDWHPWKKNLYRAISIMGCDSTHGFCLLLTCLDLLKMICYFLNGKPTAWWIYRLCLICCWGPLSKAKLGFTLCWSNIAMDKPPFTDDFILFVYKPPFIVLGYFSATLDYRRVNQFYFFPWWVLWCFNPYSQLVTGKYSHAEFSQCWWKLGAETCRELPDLLAQRRQRRWGACGRSAGAAQRAAEQEPSPTLEFGKKYGNTLCLA